MTFPLLGVSAINGLFRVDISNDDIQQVYNNRCYGFTFSETNYYLADQVKKNIIVFDLDFCVNSEMSGPSIQLVRSHQMQYHKHSNMLWVTTPRPEKHGNDICIYDFMKKDFRVWTPIKNPHRLHYNSLCFRGDLLHILAHNYHVVPSILYTYNWKTLTLIKEKKLHHGDCHNIFYFNNDLFYCASKQSKIICIDGSMLVDTGPDGGDFIRGIALNDKYLFVGTSVNTTRPKYTGKDGLVLIYNISTQKFVKKIRLPKAGAVHEIRILDGVDYAHTVK